MDATLTIERAHRTRLVTIDCPCGTTEVLGLDAPRSAPSDAELVALALAAHRREQPRCRCIRALERRYGGWSCPTIP